MKKLLILENRKTISNMISYLSKNEDYKVVSYEHYSAKEKMPKLIPDLVIADLTSIKNEKVELLMHLKNNPVISQIPFLLITSNYKSEMQDQFSRHNYYLNKPFKKEDLFTTVKKIIKHTESLNPW